MYASEPAAFDTPVKEYHMSPLTEDVNGNEIHVQVGQGFEIALHENTASTGFRWAFVSSGEPTCTLVDDSVAGSAGPPGRGVQHVWRFTAQQAGLAHIALAYARPWERDVAPARTFAIDVRVTA